MMFRIATVLALSFAQVQANVINQNNGDIPLNSKAGRNLIQNSRKATSSYSGSYGGSGQSQYDGNYQEIDWDSIDTSYLAGYSVKFQGCHHVQQWNDDAEDEDDIKIMTQRLVRFRMCPADSCSSITTKGCDKNYGDYLVDMETYVALYMDQMQEQYMNQNSYYQNNGNRQLSNNNNNNNNNSNKYNMNIEDYMSCQEMSLDDDQRERARELRQRKLSNGYSSNYYQYSDDDVSYYIGPYCAEQGGEIRLGVFYDDTCTVKAEEGSDMFESAHNGMALPYSKQSMVSLECMSCGGYGEVNELCQSLYEVAGKCETKMSVYYPNESACTYLQGIKIIREDGVIRTSATRKSTAAAVSTGVFLTAAVLLSGYVYYLRTKLGRARINLAGGNSSL